MVSRKGLRHFEESGSSLPAVNAVGRLHNWTLANKLKGAVMFIWWKAFHYSVNGELGRVAGRTADVLMFEVW